MEEILDIIIKSVASVLGLALVYAVKAGYAYLKSRLEAAEQAKLDMFIGELVYGAEQMLKADDETGAARLEYVYQVLMENGIEITDAVRAMIEARVYDLNQSAIRS